MRQLDDIIPPSRRQTDAPGVPPMSGAPRQYGPRRGGRFPFLTVGIVVVIIALSIGALYYFSGAKVEVTPNSLSASVQGTFTATKSMGDLPFEIVTAQKVASQSIPATGTKAVSASASGKITVYNTQSRSQRLIANTRFATASGLVFRIHSAISIPAGSATKPGSVEATVYADQPGDTYNVGPTSFTVPGLAGTPEASAVYARSTEAMSGGASGTIPVTDPSAEASARATLVSTLRSDLLANIQSQVPSGYVLIPGSSTTTFVDLAPAASATAGQADVKEQGTLTAVIFPNAALAQAVASSTAGLGYQGEPVTLADASTLSLAPVGGFPNADAASFSFTLSGTASLTYQVDSARISSAIAGKSRSEAETALTNYPEVKRAIIVLRPFWRSSLPEDPSSISVVVEAP